MPLRRKLLEKLFLKAAVFHDVINDSNLQRLSSILDAGDWIPVISWTLRDKLLPEGCMLDNAADVQVHDPGGRLPIVGW